MMMTYLLAQVGVARAFACVEGPFGLILVLSFLKQNLPIKNYKIIHNISHGKLICCSITFTLCTSL